MGMDFEGLDSAFILLMSMRVLSAVLVLGAGWIIGKYTAKMIGKIPGLDKTLSTFLGGFAKYSVFAFSFVIVLGQFGVETASLIAVLGAAGLAIGLALQGTLSNISAGVMMLILRPFNVGDHIDVNGKGGIVKDLGLFGTELATTDNVYLFMPNSKIWGSEIYNYTRNGTRRQDITLTINKSHDLDKVMKAIQKIVEKDPRTKTTDDHKPSVVINAIGEATVEVIVRFWSTTDDYSSVKWDITKSLKEALDKEAA